MTTQVADSSVTTFELIEFNHVRYSRGKEAAKIRIIENGEPQDWLWMSAQDVRLNIKQYGTNDAFERALRAYGEPL